MIIKNKSIGKLKHKYNYLAKNNKRIVKNAKQEKKGTKYLLRTYSS
jgi:hypothetical protein